VDGEELQVQLRQREAPFARPVDGRDDVLVPEQRLAGAVRSYNAELADVVREWIGHSPRWGTGAVR
jgi:hypothetical protein